MNIFREILKSLPISKNRIIADDPEEQQIADQSGKMIDLLKSTNECQISIQDGSKHEENHIVHDNELVEE